MLDKWAEQDMLQLKYRQINKERRKFGELMKCEFHIHTPASYDYCLLPGKKYGSITNSEIVEIAWREGFFNDHLKDHFLKEIEEGTYTSPQYLESLKNTPFDSFKEYVAYKLIAFKLYQCEVEIAVISDHNTINGYNKLRYAINEYFIETIKGRVERTRCINLLLGIEISCSEKLHIIGMFDEKNIISVEKLIEHNIVSSNLGTYETALTMLGKVHEVGGIGYVAHINSSTINTSGLYKQTLFNLPFLNVIGITNKKGLAREIELLRTYKVNEPEDKFCFILEGDAHSIPQIGQNNTWIKMSDVSFNSLRKAIHNHKFCVFIDKPAVTDKFIKGVLIEPGKDGYLRGKKNDLFLADFSSDLNCIIGGRGTGKSTLLNMLEIAFTLESDSDQKLRFLCKNKLINILFVFQNTEYLLRFVPQVEEALRHSSGRQFYSPKAFLEYHPNLGNIRLSHHWISLYQVVTLDNETIRFNKIEEDQKLAIIRGFYRKSYSINNIVNQINQGEAGSFIREVIFNGLPFIEKNEFLRDLNKHPKNQLKSFLAFRLPSVKSSLLRRGALVDEKIGLFNRTYQGLLLISYSSIEKKHSFYLDPLTEQFESEKYLFKLRVTWGDIELYIRAITEKIGFIDFLVLLMREQFRTLERSLSIMKFVSNEPVSFTDIDEERKPITSADISYIYRQIKNKILADRTGLELCLAKYFEVIDDFSMEFNVNSKESVNSNGIQMKDIESLSLGQKVVAILTFIFEYGMFTSDNTPLIIDQPEDNLDNQYIYRNLVGSLRQIKNTRQIIVVTHSSTIVTNADSEQVIVLESDNKKGWIVNRGYPSNRTIMKHIINYLEGGEPSFKHKMNMYQTIIQ